MKVAIITMHCPLNYGAVLQTFALQSYIEMLGHTVEIIDYRPDYIVYDQSYAYVGDKRFRKNILLKLGYIIYKLPYKFRRKRNFRLFYDDKLKLSICTCKTNEDLRKKSPDADLYICGSDQIWSYANNAYKDPAYFLSFVSKEKKRVSYAASGYFPNPMPVDMEKTMQCFLSNLDMISVREGETIPLIQSLTDKPVEEVLDPVFLHDKDFWDLQKRKKTVFEGEKYILVYPVGHSSDIIHRAGLLSQKTGLPIYLISASQRKHSNVDKQIDPSPLTFLSLFSNASYIITNSFHGTAFAILFKRQFWSCSTSIANNRLSSMLNKIGLEYRLLSGNSNCDYTATINYEAVDEKLKYWVIKSENYLKKCLKD